MWNTVQIKVPSELIVLTKSGKPKLKPTLTKLGNIAKYAKEASIVLIPEQVDNSAEMARLSRVNQAQIERVKADQRRRAALPVPVQDEAKVIKFLEDLEDDLPRMKITEIITEMKKEGVSIVDKKKVKEMIKTFAIDYFRKLENEQMALNDVRAPKPMSNVDRMRAENEAEIDTIYAKVEYGPLVNKARAYTVEYIVGNKSLKKVNYTADKINVRDEVERWVKQHGPQLRSKYNVAPLSQLRIQII